MADDVQIKFGAQTGDTINQINQLNAEFKELFTGIATDVRRMADTVSSETKRANKDLKNLSDQGQGLSKTFSGMKKMMVGLFAGIGAAELTRALTGTVIEFERLKAVLSTLEGENAGARFASLQQFAKETPYDLQQVVGAFSLLKAQGLDPSNEALKSYGNTASAMGKSLDQMVQAVADASVGEMERLKEFGIVARQEGDKVTFIFDGTATTVKRNANDIQQYLKDIGNTKFAGGMEKQMATLGGAFSNLQDNLASFAMAVGDAGFSAALKEMATGFDTNSETVQTFATLLGETLSTVIYAAGDIIEGFGEGFADIFDAINDIVGLFADTTKSEFSGTEIVIKGLLAVVILFGAGFREIMNVVTAAIRIVVTSLVGFAKVADRALSFDFSGAKAAWNEWKNNVVTTVNDASQNIIETAVKSNQRLNELFTKKPKADTSGTLDNSQKNAGSFGGKGGDAAAKKAAAEAKRLREEQLREFVADIRYRQELAENDRAEQMRLENEKLAEIKRVYGEQSKEYKDALRDRERLQQKHNEEIARLQREAIAHEAELKTIRMQAQQALLDQTFESERAALEKRFELENTDAVAREELRAELANREIQAQIDHEDAIFKIKAESMKDQIKLYTKGSDEYIKALQAIEQAEVEHKAKMEVLRGKKGQVQQQGADNVQLAQFNKLKTIADPIQQSFEGMFQSVLTGQASFKDAMVQMMDQLVMQSIMAIARIPIEWAAMELAKTTATLLGITTRTGAEATGAATSASINAANATTAISANAATAASGAAASQASIPIVGPAMAAASAAAILALVMGFTSIISAAGGADIGSGVNPMAQLHEEEMVLPKNIANPLRSMLAKPQTSGLGGMAMSAGETVRNETNSKVQKSEANFNYSPTISAGGSANLETMLNKEGSQMRRWISNQVRSGKLKVF